MSFNVLVITEDCTQDRYIVGPLVEKLFQHMGKKAKVIVCTDPRFRGLSQCTNFEMLRDQVVERYKGMIDLFLLVVDRDADANRIDKLTDLETRLREHLKPAQVFLADQAWQEVEVWAMAGHTLPNGWSWQEIRQERDVKERFYLPLAKEKGYSQLPYQGRKKMMEESLKSWSRVLQICPEDIGRLLERLQLQEV